MLDVVESAIEAHGGLEQWRKVSHVSADFAAYGAGLRARGPVGDAIAQTPMRVTVNVRKQDVSFDGFLGAGRKGVYAPDRTVIFEPEGSIAEALDHPRESLKDMVPGVPWTGAQLLYFFGYSLWMYITAPYTFLRDGVVCEEARPWTGDGETWRGVKVTYPPSFPSHSTEQIHYFDDHGRMRRQDYSVDVRHDLKVAHYMNGQRLFDGFLFPTERRIYRAAADGTPDFNALLIAADLNTYTVTRDAS